MNATLWSLLAAIPAVAMEYFYRVLPGPWVRWSWIYIPLSALISFCICKLVTQPGVPLVGALVVWSLAIMGTRVFVTIVLLRDVVPMGTWAALVLMLAARYIQQVWK